MRTAVGSHGTVHTPALLQKRHDARQTLPALFCDSPGCLAPACFIAEQAVAGTDRHGPVTVPAHIVLEQGAAHAPGCRYDPRGRLHGILAAVADPGFLQTLDDGRQELRLLGLQQALKRGNATSPLDDYLRTVGALAVLRALCADDTLLAAQLTLRLGKKKVAWDGFFYPQDRYDEACERVASMSSGFPLALAGTVRSHRSPQAGSGYGPTYLNCTAQYRHGDVANRHEYFEVSIGHDDAAWLQRFPVGSEIVMLGLWRLGSSQTATRPHPQDPRRMLSTVTHKLSLRPVSKAQLIAVD